MKNVRACLAAIRWQWRASAAPSPRAGTAGDTPGTHCGSLYGAVASVCPDP